MKRPKLKVELENLDKVYNAISIVGLLLLVGIPAYYYGSLPDEIPVHFGADGEADGFGSKQSIWMMPGIGVLMFGGLWALSKVPHVYNYPVEITEENAAAQYQAGARLIRVLNALIMIVFAYITYKMTRSATGQFEDLPSYFTPLLIVTMTIIIGVYIFQSATSK